MCPAHHPISIQWSKAFIINKHHANPHLDLILPPTTYTNNQYLCVMFFPQVKNKTKKGTSEHKSRWQFGKILSFFMFRFYKTFKIREENSKLEFLSMMSRKILTALCPATENWYLNIWFLQNTIECSMTWEKMEKLQNKITPYRKCSVLFLYGDTIFIVKGI